MVYWGSPATDTNLCPLKVGLVEYFFIHSVLIPSTDEIRNTEARHMFAKVKWYQDHIRPFHLHHPLRLVGTHSLNVKISIRSYL